MKTKTSARPIDPEDRVALVSGATGGMGNAICLRLLLDGMRVVMLGRDEAKLGRARQALTTPEHRDRLFTQVVDIGDAASVQAAVAQVIARFGAVTDLVHAAGDGPVAPLLETTEAMWHHTVNGKLMGTVRLTRAVAAEMACRRSGRIVVVNGVFSLEPDPLFPINSTVNCALAGFAKAISRDLGRQGIRVNVVNPGATATPLWNDICRSLAQRFGVQPEDIDRQVQEKIPSGRLASPADVAEAVSFLLSARAEHINGAALDVDGGATAAV
ncbi:SDR family oxidoreductase [Ideonella sp. DXS29W]|uniref:SDR family oxidoreductase n=1 Tax=Ideonella lacteola TaxID=2984193 RepID=A0ABU9BXG8_9BURK